MAILVTGGAGYIGSVTTELLRARGEQCVVLDNLSRGKRAAVAPNVPFYKGDVGDRELITRVVQEHNVESCIHFAAFAYVGESVLAPALYFENNVEQGIRLLGALVSLGVRLVVFSSTCATYGEPITVPIDENHAQNPTNPYGWSKLFIERIMGNYDRAYDLKFVALRYFNAAGATPERGEDHDPETHLIPLVLKAAQGTIPHVTVFGDDYPTADGTCVRDYIHVADLAEAHALALDYLRVGNLSAAINLGNGHGYSVFEVIASARSVTQRDIKVEVQGRRAGDPSHLIADASRARDVLGWQPRRPELATIIGSALEMARGTPERLRYGIRTLWENSMKSLIRYGLICTCLLIAACARSGDSSKNLRLAFVTNNASDFWTIARRGTEKADTELNDLVVEFRIPSDGTAAEQKRVVDDLLAKGVEGIAISPVDPDNQIQMINETAKQVIVVTQDSDAPKSDRAFYVGTDNVAAGRQAGALIKEVLPQGGKVMLFVGKLDARNAQERYQGIRETLQGSAVQIIDVRTDDTDRVRAKSNVSDTLVRYPDVAALVGLWSYNGPAILNAVREAGKVGQVKLIAFDEEDETLAGVKDGSIYATVVQQPYEFGYQAIKMMHTVLQGDRSVIPANKQIFVPTLVIKHDNVADFTQKINELRGRS